MNSEKWRDTHKDSISIDRALGCGLGTRDDSDWCALEWGHLGEHVTANGVHRWRWP